MLRTSASGRQFVARFDRTSLESLPPPLENGGAVMIRITAAVMALALGTAPGAGALAEPNAGAPPAAGRWQGMLISGDETLRIVVRLEERAPGRWSCFVNFIERTRDAYRCAHVTVEEDRVLLSVAEAAARFEASVTEQGAVLAGTYASPTTGTQAVRLARADDAAAWTTDPAPHKQTFVTVSDGTRLEVLDYGGQGPALIFIPGLGAGGHIFDSFAPTLTDTHRVYAISRRCCGESDRPAPAPETYSSRRLGDDVVEVMDALKIERAVLVGWSFGGVELASVGTRFPNRTAAVVYLDAAYAYTFYAPGNQQSDFNVDVALNDLTQRIVAARTLPPAEAATAMDKILYTALPDLAYDIAINRERFLEAAAQPPARAAPASAPPAPPLPAPQLPPATVPANSAVGDAIRRNVERLGPVTAPVLAIYADGPREPPPPGLRGVSMERFQRDMPALRARFKAAHPHARVVVLQNAQHAVFASNPEEVIKEMRAFLADLPR